MIKKGNMTDAEYIAMLENEIKKRDKKIDKLEIENECLKKECHIYLEALILSKHRMFGKSSEHTECDGQQSFFNEAEIESADKTEEPVKKTVKGYTRKIRKPREMNSSKTSRPKSSSAQFLTMSRYVHAAVQK